MLARMFSGSILSRRDEKVRVSAMHTDALSCTPYGSAYACKELTRVTQPWHHANCPLVCILLQGRVFLDRDPKHFRLILNYLRDGEVCLPSCPLELQEILQEALFYQVC